MNIKEMTITILQNDPLLKVAHTLPKQGTLQISSDLLIYLDIDDRYIHALYPLIENAGVEKPAYFESGIGSHISIIYPNENVFPSLEIGKTYHFDINQFIIAETEDRFYFALTVTAPDLLQLRYDQQLDTLLNLKGYQIPLHTTIGRIIK
jgi:hypothetical protein